MVEESWSSKKIITIHDDRCIKIYHKRVNVLMMLDNVDEKGKRLSSRMASMKGERAVRERQHEQQKGEENYLYTTKYKQIFQ